MVPLAQPRVPDASPSRVDRYGGGSGTVGVSTYDVSHDGLELTNYEGGVNLCDASAGAFSLHLLAVQTGDRYSFKRIDSTPNPVIIDAGNNRLIDGAPQQFFAAQYAA